MPETNLRKMGLMAPKRMGLFVSGLPAAALLSWSAGYTEAAIGLAVLAPVLHLLANKRRVPGQAAETFVPMEDLLAKLDASLENTDAVTRPTCFSFEINEFSALEKQWGKAATDALIQDVIAHIKSLLRTEDMITRTGRARFSVALPHVRMPELGPTISVIERLQSGLKPALTIEDTSVQINLSAGLCLASRAPHQSAQSMIDASVLALEEAIVAGEGTIRAYSSRTSKTRTQGGADFEEVTRALDEGEIIAWFQPQVSSDTGLVSGFEALARWSHPEKGILPPDEFVGLLEENGRMETLSETMLQHAMRALKGWDKSGQDVPSVSVNFATEELRNPSLVERIKWDVDRFAIDPKRLTIELRETVFEYMEDDIVARNIEALAEQGFRLDLDQFGAGFASVLNIRRYGVERLKIDPSFITRCDEDPTQQQMVAAIFSMSERLGISVLAAGVETIGERSILSQLGCDYLQGFAIASPMPFEETIGWMEEYKNKLYMTPRIGRRAS